MIINLIEWEADRALIVHLGADRTLGTGYDSLGSYSGPIGISALQRPIGRTKKKKMNDMHH